MQNKAKGRLADVTGKNVSITPEAHYDEWADTYDTDLLDEYGYCAHRIAVQALANLVPDATSSIMDVGCGTGLVGIELARAGYNVIDGIDVSSKMLKMAEKLGIYRKLNHVDAEAPETTPPADYDAVISVGTFGLGHMGPTGMGQVAQHAKSGGIIVLFMNAEPFVDMNFEAEIENLEKSAVWTLQSIEDHNYMDALERPGKLIVARAGDRG